MRGRGRGRGRGARSRRGAAMARSRPKKKVIESDEEETGQMVEIMTEQNENFSPKIDMEDISQLEAPTFTTLNRGPPEPMLRLRWDHRVSLIGEKVLNPMIHCCDKCLKPILIYGRMIPCKHVFCLHCGREEEKACPRCVEPVTRVEQTVLGTVFMCTHGGTRYGHSGCRRTYLSQRDLQAHINHRHTSVGDDSNGPPAGKVATIVTAPRKITQATSQNDPRSEASSMQYRNQSQRSNLITVPIQEDENSPVPPPPQITHYHQSGPSSGGGVSNPPPTYAPSSAPPPPPPSASYYPTPPPPGYYPTPPPPPPPYSTPPPQYPGDPAAAGGSYWPHPPPPIHQFYR